MSKPTTIMTAHGPRSAVEVAAYIKAEADRLRKQVPAEPQFV